jgi:putative tryptophan/tyrosine transport system substrate-binding protein
MRRRDVLRLLGSAAVSWPLGVLAQSSTSGRTAHIAYLGALSPVTLDPRQIESFKAGLVENGLVEGQNMVVDYLWAEGSPDRLQQLASELGKRDLNVIVSAGPQAIHALMATRTNTPIVFAILGDPIGNGIVESLARPGGNVTGLSMSNTDLESKRIEVLKDAVPALSRVMILHDPSMGAAGMPEAAAAARALAVEPLIIETSDPAQFEAAFGDAASRGANGLSTTASPFLNFHRKPLIQLAARHHLPSIWEGAAYVRDGGLLSYGPSFPDMYRRSAAYVAKIINGSKPSELPVQQPIRFELAVNLATARALGLEMPPTLLARADEVIE